MAQLTASLKLKSKGKEDNYQSVKKYNEEIEVEQIVDNTDGFIEVVNFTETKGTNTLSASKGFNIVNLGPVGCEIQYKVTEWKDNSSNVDIANSVDTGESTTTTRYVTRLLPANSFIWEDNARYVGYNDDKSAGKANALDNATPAVALKSGAIGATVDDATSATTDSTTTLYIEEYTSASNCGANLFKVGDIIRLASEIMEVTAIGDKSNLANNYLTVKRGVHGSTAGAHADGVEIELAFHNMTNAFDKYSSVQTNKTGRWHSKNFFGIGRTATGVSDGIVPSSVAIKFYTQGYQELGLSGITLNTETGLTAGTTYEFDITLDGGSAFTVNVAIDSNNTKFGGPNGLLTKINAIFEQAFYTTGNLFGKKVTVGIVDGDVRFTSGSHLTGSKVVLGVTSGSTNADIWNVGRIPALLECESSVLAKVEDDVIYDNVDYSAKPNINTFAYDDGNGNILGQATGTVNYETGEISFVGPPEANFVVSAQYASAHSGGVETSTDNFNNIQSIGARSLNSKVNTTVVVKAFN